MSEKFNSVDLNQYDKKDILTKLLVFPDGSVLISKLVYIAPLDIGEPDIVLIEPHVISENIVQDVLTEETQRTTPSLTPWLFEYADINQNQFYIHSDKILTMATPNAELLSEYHKRFG
jgi:hypothetical protein